MNFYGYCLVDATSVQIMVFRKEINKLQEDPTFHFAFILVHKCKVFCNIFMLSVEDLLKESSHMVVSLNP